jgi:hypothetical protein
MNKANLSKQGWRSASDGEAATDHSGAAGHLHRHAVECGASGSLGHAGDLEEHGAGLNAGRPVVDIGFAGTHSGFQRLLADGLVWEDADEELAFALEEVLAGDAAGLDDLAREPEALERLEAVVAVGDVVALGRLADANTAELLASEAEGKEGKDVRREGLKEA